MTSVTLPSRPIRTKALGAKLAASAASAPPIQPGILTLNINPPLAAAPAVRNVRRDGRIDEAVSSSRSINLSNMMLALLSGSSRRRGGVLDGFANPDISAAAADV